MKRTAWKWIFGIALAVLILLILFTVAIWILLNIGGAIFLTLLGNQQITAISFSAFMANFVGSPIFYIYLADLAVLLGSSVVLFATRKTRS